MLDRIDLQNEAFDLYFADAARNLTQRQREVLPSTVYRGLFVKNQTYKISSISFFRKLYILLRALNKRFFLVIEDEENGLSTDAFIKLKEAEKNKEIIEDTPFEQSLGFSFCLADKDLVDWLSYINGLCNAPAYSYSLKLKNENLKQFPKYKEQVRYLGKMFLSYEKNKIKIQKDMRVTMAEFYLLLHLYDGEKKPLTSFYNGAFKDTPGCSRRTITDALRKMLFEKSIERFNSCRYAEYKITPYGTQMINEIMKKYMIPNE